MTTSQIVFLRRNKNRNGLIPVYIRITKNRRSAYINTGIHLEEKHWNQTKNKVKPSHPNSARINAIIASKMAKVQRTILEYEWKNKYYSVDHIRDKVLTSNPDCFLSYYQKWLEDRYHRGKIAYSTYSRYQAVISKLSTFADNYLAFDEFTYEYLLKYETYLLRDLENSQNTVNSNFNCLRKAMRDAVRNGKIAFEADPFFRYQFKLVQPERTFLTAEEIGQIEKLDSFPSELSFIARDIFVFITQSGLRIGDVLMLRNQDFNGERISLIMGKSRIQTSILLTAKAKDIIMKYHNDDPEMRDNFIFPLLKVDIDEKDPRKWRNAVSSATYKINRCLQRTIIPRTSIKKHISTHLGRHSLATQALLKGMSYEEIKSILKHRDVKITQQYAKVVDQFADNAIRKFERL